MVVKWCWGKGIAGILLENCLGVMVLVDQFWWNSFGGTVLVIFFGGTVMDDL